MVKKKRTFPPSIKVYIDDPELLKSIKDEAKKHNISVSKLGGYAVGAGLPSVVAKLDGLKRVTGGKQTKPS